MHRSSSRQTVHNLTINGGQGGAGGAGRATGGTGGAGGTGTGPTVNYAVRTKSFVVNYTTPGVPSDFRMIPLGDIDLQHEIGVKKYTGVLNYQPERARVRRVYSARVDGRNSSVTVVMYQGTGAEEEWREDVTKYKTVRHPNLVQVWGTASMGNIHATIFHDDLIPFEDLLDLHKDSPLLTLYIWAYIITGFTVVQNYFESTLQRDLHDTDCTFFIRRSTGQFCADLIPNDESLLWMALDSDTLLPQGLEPLDAPNIETIAINFLTLDQYHRGCYFCLAKYRSSGGSTPRLVTFGTVYYISADNDPVEIASMPEAEFDHYHYYSKVSFGDQLREGMEKGWTQVTSEVAADSKSDFVWVHSLRDDDVLAEEWLSQAKHIFNRLGISSNFENYVMLYRIEFHLTISQLTRDPPEGFLFLCPPEDFHIGDTMSFKWPDCPAYWSFDPSGTERLSADEAVSFGFPTLVLSRRISRFWWDANMYASLRRFHQAKGFDPDSQDVAQHLGYPLYELSREFHGQFAHINEEDSCDGNDATDEDSWDSNDATDGDSQDDNDDTDEEFDNILESSSNPNVSFSAGSQNLGLPNYTAFLAPVRTAARMNVPATQSDMSTVPLIPIPALEPWMFEFTRAPAANPALDFSPNFNLDFLMGTPSNEDWTANSIFPALDVPGMIQPTLFGLDKDNFNTLIPHVSNFAVDGLTDAFPELSDTVPSASTSTGQFDAWPWPFLRPHLPDSSPATALAQFSEPGPNIANSRGITVPSMRKRHAEEEISEQPLKKGKGRAWN